MSLGQQSGVRKLKIYLRLANWASLSCHTSLIVEVKLEFIFFAKAKENCLPRYNFFFAR